jgi:curli biogenesis system outer membrane secretion channel CsgG
MRWTLPAALAILLSSCTRTHVRVMPAVRSAPVRRIAVADFAYSYSDRDSPKLMNVLIAGSYVNPAAGRVIADRLGEELAGTGRYRLVERSQIQSLLEEHELQRTDFTTIEGARKMGKLLDVDAILVGGVDLFQITWVLFLVRSDVGLSARLVDIETGEVLWFARARRTFYYAPPEDVADGLIRNLAAEIDLALAAALASPAAGPEAEGLSPPAYPASSDAPSEMGP